MSKRKVYCAVGGEYSDYHVYAIFTTREAAEEFIADKDSHADAVEVRTLYDSKPPRSKWHVIERMKVGHKAGEVAHRSVVTWDFDGAPYVGWKRDSWNYSTWEFGERAFGKDKAAVEKAWAEAQAANEAEAMAR